jgi:hypothetical protein
MLLRMAPERLIAWRGLLRAVAPVSAAPAADVPVGGLG